MRQPYDGYPSASWHAWVLLEHLAIDKGCSILEPCAGDGAIADEYKRAGYHVQTNDLDTGKPTDTHHDYLMVGFNADWVVTNPPFDQALAFLQKALSEVGQGVALQLRLSFLEPTLERGGWLEQHPPQRQIVVPRYSFVKHDNGKRRTDWMTTAWMIWLTPFGFMAHEPISRPIEIVSWTTIQRLRREHAGR